MQLLVKIKTPFTKKIAISKKDLVKDTLRVSLSRKYLQFLKEDTN